MRTTRHWLMTIAALLCSLAASAATYSDWTSTNKGQGGTTSSNTYTITANAGDVLTFDWLVSSESNFDKLIITIGGTEILNKSGEYSGTYQHTFTSSGTYSMEVKYTKDGSVNNGSDYAKVYNINLGTGGTEIPENIAASGTCGDNITWQLTNLGKLILEGTGDLYYEYIYPWIGYEMDIRTIVIEEGITSIGEYAFSDHSNLTSISIPKSVTNIDSWAFGYCSNLTTVAIAENSQLTNIGLCAFFKCSSLTSITIPKGVTSIGSSAFEECGSITTITIPESVTDIADEAFRYCSNLSTFTIPDNSQLINIGENAFCYCSSITSITIPESMTRIGDSAFRWCGMTSINIPESVTSLGEKAFEGCTRLTSISIPKSVTSIGESAFAACNRLTSITIPEGVTSIGDYTFCECWSLTSITLPKTIDHISWGVFSNCSSLTEFICYAEWPPYADIKIFSSLDLENVVLKVPACALDRYRQSSSWSVFENIVPIEVVAKPEDITTITINQYGSGTYSSEYALDFSEVEGLKAYAATGYNTKTGIVTLTRVMTSQPGMGLFLKGETGEYIVPTLESTDDNSLNMLVGALENTELNGTSDNGLYYNYRYTIKEGDEAPKFYQVDDDYTLGAGKAYLQIPVAWMTTQAKAIDLRFDDGGTTDIDELESESNGQNAELIYDLMGRRVTSPQRGMIYIVNGKKVVMD